MCQDEGQPKPLLQDNSFNVQELSESALHFFHTFFVCGGGVTLIHNVVFKKKVVVHVLFFSLEHEYPWKYHMSSNIAVLLLLPSGNTLHYHPDDCLESCNMDFISV